MKFIGGKKGIPLLLLFGKLLEKGGIGIGIDFIL